MLTAAAALCSQPATAFLASPGMPVRARGLPALAGRPPAAGISRRHARGVLGMTSLLTPTAPIVEGTSRRWDSIKKKRQELTPEREEEIRNVFAQLDVDKSGALSSDELQLALKEMGIYKSKEEVGLTIKEIDANDNDQVDATEVGVSMGACARSRMRAGSVTLTFLWGPRTVCRLGAASGASEGR